jgi:hypothetical protein
MDIMDIMDNMDNSHSGQTSGHTVHITINNAFLLGTISLHYRDNSVRRASSGGHITSLYDAGAVSPHAPANPEKNPSDCTLSQYERPCLHGAGFMIMV